MAVRIGDAGRALTPMSPSGAVEVNGRRLDARSEGGYIEAGSSVVVVRGDPTGYVVRKIEPGQPPPTLPNSGAPIQKAEGQQNSAEVAEADRKARAEARKELIRRTAYGSIAAVCLGALAGLASGGAGWYFGWSGVADPQSIATLLGASAGVGAAAGVVLFVLTGLIAAGLGFLQEGEAEFAPNFLVVFAALAGAVVGFWWRFGTGDAATIAQWSGGVGVGFAVVAYVLSWLVGNVLQMLVGGE